MKLSGRNILITGALRGIGRGRHRPRRTGANIGINYRSQAAEAEETAAIVRKHGGKAELYQVDVSDQPAVEKMVESFARRLRQRRRLHLQRRLQRPRSHDQGRHGGLPQDDRRLEWGAFYGVRAAAQKMVAQEGGSIIVVSSPHGKILVPTAMAYNMAKAAIDHMARTAAIELAQYRIRVNIIHPGWIDTPANGNSSRTSSSRKGRPTSLEADGDGGRRWGGWRRS